MRLFVVLFCLDGERLGWGEDRTSSVLLIIKLGCVSLQDRP